MSAIPHGGGTGSRGCDDGGGRGSLAAPGGAGGARQRGARSTSAACDQPTPPPVRRILFLLIFKPPHLDATIIARRRHSRWIPRAAAARAAPHPRTPQQDPWPPGHLFEKQVGLELPLTEGCGNNNFYGDERHAQERSRVLTSLVG